MKHSHPAFLLAEVLLFYGYTLYFICHDLTPLKIHPNIIPNMFDRSARWEKRKNVNIISVTKLFIPLMYWGRDSAGPMAIILAHFEITPILANMPNFWLDYFNKLAVFQ